MHKFIKYKIKSGLKYEHLYTLVFKKLIQCTKKTSKNSNCVRSKKDKPFFYHYVVLNAFLYT